MRPLLGVAVLVALAGCGGPARPLTGFAIGLVDETPAPAVSVDVAGHAPPPTPRPSSSSYEFSGGSTGSAPSGGGGAVGPAPTPSPGSVGIAVGTGDRYALARVAGDAADGMAIGADGPGARFGAVSGLAVAPDGTLWASDAVHHQVRHMTAAGPVELAAGDAAGRAGYFGDNVPAIATRLSAPMGLAMDPGTGAVLVADSGNGRVRVFPPGGRIYTLAGGGGSAADVVNPATNALLQQPWGLAVDTARRVLVSDRGTGKLRRVEADGRLTTVAAFAAGQLGAIAATTDGATAWAAVGAGVWRCDTAVAGGAPTRVFDAGVGAVTGLAYDQAGTLFVLATADATGRVGTMVWRVPTGLAGRSPVRIAGQPGQAGAESDYSAPTAGLPDAVTGWLTAAHGAGLAIDVRAAADPLTPSGILYQANSYDDGAGARWGAINRLTP